MMAIMGLMMKIATTIGPRDEYQDSQIVDACVCSTFGMLWIRILVLANQDCAVDTTMFFVTSELRSDLNSKWVFLET